jgi:hypothetical protein
VILCCEREIGTANAPTGLPQTIEGLRAGHLVNEMQINEKQVGFTLCGSHDVVIPHLLAQCLAHGA